jgi:hypothetical protein
MPDEDLDLKTRITDILECASKEIIALVEAHRYVERSSPEPLPEWMTAVQLAHYWQLVNASGEAITAGIMKWTKRAEKEHPLPHACMGDLLGFKRERSIGGRRKKLHFVGLRRIERNYISLVKTVTRSKLLIEWLRSLKDGCHSSKGENEWQSGSVTTESASRGEGTRGKGTWIVEFRLRGHYVKQAIPEARTRADAE